MWTKSWSCSGYRDTELEHTTTEVQENSRTFFCTSVVLHEMGLAGNTSPGGDGVKERSKYIIIGLLAGVANGFFGAGGGLFLVPLFVGWVGLEQRKAFATSVAVVLPLCVAALISYVRKGGVDVAVALPYLAGGLVGGVLAGRVFDKIPVLWLRRGFGALLVYGGVKAVLLL